MNKREKLLIVGKSGSGKDYLMRKLSDIGLKPCVKITTRPIRKLEVDGVSYNFLSESTFNELLSKNLMFLYQEFFVQPIDRPMERWLYGISHEEFEKSQVFIMTPGEISQLNNEIRKNCFVVYLDIDRKVRESRILNRGDNNDSVIRRLDADDVDFKDFNDYDLKVSDPDFKAEDIYDLMF